MRFPGRGAEPAVSEAAARPGTAEGRLISRNPGRAAARAGAGGSERVPPAAARRLPRWERWLGQAAAERSLGDGGAAATRPVAPKAGKPGSPGTRRSPGTAGTPPSPPGEPPLRRPPRPRSRSGPPNRLPGCCHHHQPRGRPGRPSVRRAPGPFRRPLSEPPRSPPDRAGSLLPAGLSQPRGCLDVTPESPPRACGPFPFGVPHPVRSSYPPVPPSPLGGAPPPASPGPPRRPQPPRRCSGRPGLPKPGPGPRLASPSSETSRTHPPRPALLALSVHWPGLQRSRCPFPKPCCFFQV